jgi:hypothetical protein
LEKTDFSAKRPFVPKEHPKGKALNKAPIASPAAAAAIAATNLLPLPKVVKLKNRFRQLNCQKTIKIKI